MTIGVFRSSSSGRSTDLREGGRFCVALEEIPSTGYTWVEENTVGLEKVGDSFEDHPPALLKLGVPESVVEESEEDSSDEAAPGSSSLRLMIFEIKRGEHSGEVELAKMRPWDPTTVVEKFSFRAFLKD